MGRAGPAKRRSRRRGSLRAPLQHAGAGRVIRSAPRMVSRRCPVATPACGYAPSWGTGCLCSAPRARAACSLWPAPATAVVRPRRPCAAGSLTRSTGPSRTTAGGRQRRARRRTAAVRPRLPATDSGVRRTVSATASDRRGAHSRPAIARRPAAAPATTAPWATARRSATPGAQPPQPAVAATDTKNRSRYIPRWCMMTRFAPALGFSAQIYAPRQPNNVSPTMRETAKTP